MNVAKKGVNVAKTGVSLAVPIFKGILAVGGGDTKFA